MEMDFRVVREISGRYTLKRRWVLINQQIDVGDPAQIAHWCREFGCTWVELFSAIDRVGTNAASVGSALRNAVR